MKRTAVFAAPLLITLISGGCGAGAGVPQDVLDAATNAFMEQFCNPKKSEECDEITVKDAKRSDPTPAQKKSGYTDIYHVGFGFITKYISQSDWKDEKRCMFVGKTSGDWSIKEKFYDECK